jgi:MFS family permease
VTFPRATRRVGASATSAASRRARLAVTAVFAANGALFASVFSRLPAIRADLDLSEGRLGLALLCAMVALLASQPIAGALAARLGSRPVVLAGALAYSAALVPVALAGSLPALGAAFALLGLASGVLDVSMNVQGLTVERALRRPILATLHAAFSFGALGGSAAGALVAAAGVGVVHHLAAMAAFGAALALVATRALMPASADAAAGGPLLARPSRALAALGAIAFCALLAEGAVNDWAAVYLDRVVAAGEATAALGLAAFSLTMGLGRLAGDRLTTALGAERLARAGALLAAAGLVAALAAGGPLPAIAGFALMGLGLATLLPLALRAAASRAPQAGPAVAAVSGTGYLGFLVGPPTIGGAAELADLRVALLIVLALCGVAAVLAPAAVPVRGSAERAATRRPAFHGSTPAP